MWREFVELAEKREESFAALCARFGVSRKTGYKWLNRFRAAGVAGLQQQSRRPKSSPRRTPDSIVDAVLAARREHPDWSVARLQTALEEAGISPLPAASTIDLILKRQREAAAARLQALGPDAQRFEPNYRWVLELGPEFALADGTSAQSLIVRDETTGYWVGVALLTTRREEVLANFVKDLVRRQGLPWRMQFPQASELRGAAPSRAHTPSTVWLMQAGVVVEFSAAVDRREGDSDQERLAARLATLAPYQRTLLADHSVVTDPLTQFARDAVRWDARGAETALGQLRDQHNFGGKQEAMQRRSPISLYRPSVRLAPAEVTAPVYAPEADVRLVSEKGIFTFQRRLVHVGRAFAGHCVELKLTPYPERFLVLFAGQMLGMADLSATPVDHTTSLQLSAP